MPSYTKKELNDLRPVLDKAVQKFFGFAEPSVVNAAVNCLGSGYDRDKTMKTLASLLDEDQAKGFTGKMFRAIDDYKRDLKKGRKRRDESEAEAPFPAVKRAKPEEPVTHEVI